MAKILPCRFKQQFGAFNMLTTHKRSDTALFSHLSNATFWSLYFHKQITSEAHPFSQVIQNFIEVSEMKKKTQKKFFDFR